MAANHKLIYGVNDFETWCKQNNKLDVLKEWDIEKNNGLMPKDVFKSSKIKYFWKCKLGHSYASNTTNRQQWGCPYCGSRKLLKGFNDFETWCKKNNMVYLLDEWDYEKNDKLPIDYFPFTPTKVWWVGECGHSFEMSIAKRSSGKMCSICGKEFKTSFPEQSIYYYVSKKYKDTVNSFILNGKEIDIFIPSLKIGIEYDGFTWHKDKKRDIEKNRLCEENGIILYRIREKNLPIFEETDFLKIVYCETDCSEEKEVEKSINKLLYRLNVINKSISLDKDRINIYRNFISRIKKNSFGSLHPELIHLWDIEKNGSLTPYMFSSGSNKKVWWKGKCGHSWDMSIREIVIGYKCPYCSGKRLKIGINDLFTKYPDLVNMEWDFDKNVIKPNEIFCHSIEKVWWRCKNNHSYLARIDRKVKLNSGCPYCEHRKLSDGETDLLSLRPEVIKFWDYNRNKKKPNEVFAKTNDKYWFKCEKGHKYLMSVNTWVRSKNTCPICNGKVILKGFNDFESHFPIESKYWDYNRNKLKPDEVFKSSSIKYWFKCEKGHSFERSPDELPKKVLCPYCGNSKLLEGFNDLATVRPDLVRDWDFKKNKLMPNEVIVNSSKKAYWKCHDCGKEWYSIINLRTGKENTKCPNCVYKNNEERRIKISNRNSKKIINIDTQEVYKNAKEAEEKTGVKAANIYQVLCGKSKTAGGYRWKHYKE